MRPMARDWSTLAVVTCMSPARREAFTKITGSQIFSLKFFPPRWVENACVANRVLRTDQHLLPTNLFFVTETTELRLAGLERQWSTTHVKKHIRMLHTHI